MTQSTEVTAKTFAEAELTRLRLRKMLLPEMVCDEQAWMCLLMLAHEDGANWLKLDALDIVSSQGASIATAARKLCEAGYAESVGSSDGDAFALRITTLGRARLTRYAEESARVMYNLQRREIARRVSLLK